MRVRKILLIIVIMFSMSFVLRYENVRADSGWDSSYESGSSFSYDSSSDRGSYSSRDHGSSRSKSSGSEITRSIVPISGLVSMLFIFLAIYFIIIMINCINKKNPYYNVENRLMKLFYIFVFLHVIYMVLEIVISYYNKKIFELMYYLDFIIPLIMVVISFIVPYIMRLFKYIKNKRFELMIKTDVDIDDNLMKYLDCFSLDDIKKSLYDSFISIQKAWMDFDYESLKRLCLNELYNTYHEELETLKLINEKNVMNSFKLNNDSLYRIKRNDNIYRLYYYLDVTFIDYVINTETDKVIRGKKSVPLNNKYLLEFEVCCSDNVNKCPQCGAILNDDNDVCKYCGSKINKDSNHLVLANKRIYKR